MEISQSIARYCEYQERCHSEVRNKLYELGCYQKEVEQHITELIERGLLNEERFARAYARGKFRMKQWGKVKIKQELRLRKISEYCIKKAMTEIDEEEYDAVLNKLMDKKLHELRGERSEAKLKGKVFRYIIQKGYEMEIVTNLLTEKIKNK